MSSIHFFATESRVENRGTKPWPQKWPASAKQQCWRWPLRQSAPAGRFRREPQKKPPVLEGLYHPFLMILRTVYDIGWFTTLGFALYIRIYIHISMRIYIYSKLVACPYYSCMIMHLCIVNHCLNLHACVSHTFCTHAHANQCGYATYTLHCGTLSST